MVNGTRTSENKWDDVLKMPEGFYCHTWHVSKLEFQFTISDLVLREISNENQWIFQFSDEMRNMLRQSGSLWSKRSMPNATACERKRMKVSIVSQTLNFSFTPRPHSIASICLKSYTEEQKTFVDFLNSSQA
uniref:Uncharacterized protein n=1 Tax=Glossina pallidipes TaxID=7398 RepID=A0A1A9Z3F9_GLOPL